MDVKILGSRANTKLSSPKHMKHSGVLVDDKILLDLGEEEYLNYKPDYIFITHLHPDHAYFVENNIENIKIPIFAPEAPNNEGLIEISNKTMNFDAYKITPIPTHHSKLVESQAYIIEKNKSKLLYTGDLIWIDKKFHDINIVITDGSYYRKGGLIRKDNETRKIYGHNGIKDLIKLFEDFTNHIVFTHLGSWFYRDIEESKKKIKSLSTNKKIVEPAYDGMTIEI